MVTSIKAKLLCRIWLWQQAQFYHIIIPRGHFVQQMQLNWGDLGTHQQRTAKQDCKMRKGQGFKQGHCSRMQATVMAEKLESLHEQFNSLWRMGGTKPTYRFFCGSRQEGCNSTLLFFLHHKLDHLNLLSAVFCFLLVAFAFLRPLGLPCSGLSI